MKKTIVLNLVLLCTAIFSYSFGRSTGELFITDGPDHITTLIINAKVTVVLVNNDNATLEMTGRNSFSAFVTFKKTKNTLVIGSTRGRDLKDDVIIYVPASQLREIRINSEADVRSLYALRVPKLDVVINGDCKIAVSNFGEVNLTPTESYSVEQTTEVRRHPADILLKKNDQAFIAEK